MREILFRGKSIIRGEWIYGYLNQHRGNIRYDCDCEPIADGCYYINDWQAKIDTGMYGQDYKVDPDTIGQFTGLEDKLGTKIFEGDVIDDLGVEYIVVFDSDYAQFRGKFDDWNAEISHIASRCEVIGNVYDNPELLEVSGDE